MLVEQIVYERLAVEVLQVFAGNPRKGAVEQIAKSLEKHGQYRPIVVNAGTRTGRRYRGAGREPHVAGGTLFVVVAY